MEKDKPLLTNVAVTHQKYQTLLSDFAEFYLANKEGADVIVHMGVPVEAGLLIEMHRLGYIGDWDGPFPLLDVCDFLKVAGEDPTSVDNYAAKFGLTVEQFSDGTHNPLYDAAITAAVYHHLRGQR